MTGNLGNDLGCDGRSGSDRPGRFNFRITHAETVGHHPFNIDQHAVEHREEGGVVQVVVMDFTTIMGSGNVLWQNMLSGIVPGDHTGQKVPLGRDDFAVLVGVLVEQLFIYPG